MTHSEDLTLLAREDISTAPAFEDAGTPMLVTLDQLRPYENNPRRSRNPLYDEIKESIRTRGLDSPPQITQRPGENFFIIRNGGNTRLSILKELWQETGDLRYFQINCLYRPWEGETSTLVGHLAENEMRGALTFIDKAVGLHKLKQMYEEEHPGAKPLSLRRLSERLKNAGLPVSFSLLGKMLSCVDVLLPVIPNLLARGLGRPQIEKLLSLHSGLAQIYKQYVVENGEERSFKEIWTSVLTGFDLEDGSPDQFRIDIVQDTLLGELSRQIGRSYRLIELDLLDLERAEEARTASQEAVNDEVTTAGVISETRPVSSGKAAKNRLTIKQQQLSEIDRCEAGVIHSELRGKDASVGDILGRLEQRQASVSDLRDKLYQLALQFGRWCGKADHVRPCAHGLGFTILDFDSRLPKENSVLVLLTRVLRFDETLSEASDDEVLAERLFSIDLLSQALLGMDKEEHGQCERVPDGLLMSYFRMVQLARRLKDQLRQNQSKTDQQQKPTRSPL